MTRAAPPTAYKYNKHTRPVLEHLSIAEGRKSIPLLLYTLLAHATPYKSESVLHTLLPGGNRHRDDHGNLIVQVGHANTHQTMFSCHLDTVHREPGVIIPMLTSDLYVYAAKEVPAPPNMTLAAGTIWVKPSILGADDKVGAYIMSQMILANVPGVYVFHAGEERGGLGSGALAKNPPKWMKNIKRCIAFDRMDYDNIITRQRGGRCCSDKFAKALAEELNAGLTVPRVRFKPDPTGTFTDSANYTDLVGECTNVSIGYFKQHSKDEHFDLEWLLTHLIPAVLKVNWKDLPSERKAGEKDPTYSSLYTQRSGWPYYIPKKNPELAIFEKVHYSTRLVELPHVDLTAKMPLGIKEYQIVPFVKKLILEQAIPETATTVAKVVMARDAAVRSLAAAEEVIDDLTATLIEMEELITVQGESADEVDENFAKANAKRNVLVTRGGAAKKIRRRKDIQNAPTHAATASGIPAISGKRNTIRGTGTKH